MIIPPFNNKSPFASDTSGKWKITFNEIEKTWNIEFLEDKPLFFPIYEDRLDLITGSHTFIRSKIKEYDDLSIYKFPQGFLNELTQTFEGETPNIDVNNLSFYLLLEETQITKTRIMN